MSKEMNAGEVAELLGVTRQHFTDRISKRLDFPPPAQNFSPKSRRWRRADVEAWRARAANDSGRRAA